MAKSNLNPDSQLELKLIIRITLCVIAAGAHKSYLVKALCIHMHYDWQQNARGAVNPNNYQICLMVIASSTF
jgi:predicted ATPase